MKTISINEIVEAARAIAEEKGMNYIFSARGNVIEGCRKISEEFEFDTSKEEAIFDNTRDEIATSIIKDAIASLKENEEAENTCRIKVPEELLDSIDGNFLYYNSDIEIDGEEFCTFTDRCGAFDKKFDPYILEDGILSKIEVEEISRNRYGKFYWFDNHTQAVVEDSNDETGIFQIESLDEYVEDLDEQYYN